MSNKINYPIFFQRGLLAATLLSFNAAALAGAELSAGVWWVYGNVTKSGPSSLGSADELDSEQGGSFEDPALILYATDDGSHGPWHFQAEMRVGTGSFTDSRNNNSGDNFTLHKAWIAYDLDASHSLTIGKSQVPFGWKTINFWPGDLLQGGYGDQMDIGLKLSGKRARLSYDLAYYHQDDWGDTSTDTVDDNGHWGTSTTYRKVKTAVANLDYNFAEGHTVGISYQNGRMQDLSSQQVDADLVTPGVQEDTRDRNDDGTHQALDIHYYLDIENFVGKYRYIDTERDFSDMETFSGICNGSITTVAGSTSFCPANAKVENSRHALHLGYKVGENFYYYLEASSADSDTTGNTAGGPVEAYAPGVRYDYGPGWLYLEYLHQNGFVDANGDVGEGDFRSLYISFDFYF